MFYCGFDPGLEAYLVANAPQGGGQDAAAALPAPGYIWGASALLAITILSLITIGLL